MKVLSKFAMIVLIVQTGIFAQAQAAAGNSVAVGAQYDTTHVYVAPSDVDAFVKAFLGTFGGKSTPQVVATVTPTPSKTSSQLLQTPVGTVSLFGFKTPIPIPFGNERTGYLITDMKTAVEKARSSGADVIVTPFPDPIGVDAVVQWPGGVDMQLYWHTKAPSYAPFEHIPENRIYVSPDRVAAFTAAFLKFSNGKVVLDTTASGEAIGKKGEKVRQIRIVSQFGKMIVFVSDGHLNYPFGAETTGYEVDDLNATLAKAQSLGASILVPATQVDDRKTAVVRFPGGYITEIHQAASEPH